MSAAATPLPDFLQATDTARTGGATVAMLVVRLRHLHDLRIDFGHAAAWRILDAADALLARVLRPADRRCRLSDDSWAVLLPALLADNHALLAAQRIQRAFRDELALDGHGIVGAVAMGLSLARPGTGHAEALLREADLAAGQAMRSGQSLERFEPGRVQGEVPAQLLRDALHANALQVWLQPLWDLRRQRIAGAESLARWHHPERGWISPAQFVPLAEDSGLIGDFTRWSLNASLRACAEARAHLPHLHVAVNLSPRFFAEDTVVEQVLSTVRLWDLPMTAVMLEVTEGAIMQDPHRSGEILQALHAEGLGISIDDFGTGYSSFAYLQRFPATELKIDQCFIRDMHGSRRSLQLVRSMIDLAHHLDMTVVAEGVEGAASLERVADLGCDLAQGYHIRRPEPAEAFIASLA